SGADLANVVNEAALLAGRRGLGAIPADLLEEAVDRTALGVASRGTVLGPEERRLVAYHEAGHAIVALALRGPGHVHKVTIIPRGTALGHCRFVDPHERTIQSRSWLADLLAIGLGGYVAEDLVLGETSSGTASDLRAVGEIARQMVADLGMSAAVGPLAVADPSEEARRTVDAEAQRRAGEAQRRAREILVGSRAALERLAEALLDKETLTAAEAVGLIGATPLTERPRYRPAAEETRGQDGIL
ncbi:MAG: ATP-dependent zinc metalloprotease FtsH, partial [Acidimicrobiales bacterium]